MAFPAMNSVDIAAAGGVTVPILGGRKLGVAGPSHFTGSGSDNAAFSCVNMGVAMAGSLFISHAQLLNVAVGGTQSAQVLASIPGLISAGVSGILCDSGATNNGANTSLPFEEMLEAWQADVRAMAELCRIANIPLVMVNIPPRGGSTATARTRLFTQRGNEWLLDAARQHGFALVDWWTVLADPSTGNTRASMDADGTHFNRLGHWSGGNIIAPALRRAVSTSSNSLVRPMTSGVNLFANPGMTLNTVRPSNISADQSVGSPVESVFTDVSGLITGKWAQIQNPAGSRLRYKTSNVSNANFAAGDLMGVVARIQIEDVGGGLLSEWCASSTGAGSTSVLIADSGLTTIAGSGWTARLGSCTGTPDAAGAVYDLGPFLTTAVIPATPPSAICALWSAYNSSGAQTRNYRWGELGTFNLTANGLGGLP